jgi:hypothetical protein
MAVRNFRYKIKAKPAYDEWTIISPWCRENIDAHGISWGRLNGTWRIRFKRHAVLFALRWS